MSVTNSLETRFPEIAAELDPGLNDGLTADQVTAGTHTRLVWRCRNHTFRIGARPLVMGIVNVTPDSFSDGGRFFDPQWRRRFSHPIVIGWVGPLFWPYAYSDFVDYTFYPYAYDTFWPYAYDDVYDGMFGAYAVGYGGTYASVGPSGQDGG